jgi:putative acetyltransferase
MFGPVSISPAQPSGTDATTLIAHLDAELAERYPGLDRDTFMLTPEQVRAGHGVFLLAKAGGEPVGCGALRRLDRATGEIKRMYVMPSARGARVGRRLLTKLEWYARQLGMYRLVLHTGLRQPEAIQLYKSTGFALIAGFGKYNDSSAGICMAKTIILPTRPDDSEADGPASQLPTGGDRTGGYLLDRWIGLVNVRTASEPGQHRSGPIRRHGLQTYGYGVVESAEGSAAYN